MRREGRAVCGAKNVRRAARTTCGEKDFGAVEEHGRETIRGFIVGVSSISDSELDFDCESDSDFSPSLIVSV